MNHMAINAKSFLKKNEWIKKRIERLSHKVKDKEVALKSMYLKATADDVAREDVTRPRG